MPKASIQMIAIRTQPYCNTMAFWKLLLVFPSALPPQAISQKQQFVPLSLSAMAKIFISL